MLREKKDRTDNRMAGFKIRFEMACGSGSGTYECLFAKDFEHTFPCSITYNCMVLLDKHGRAIAWYYTSGSISCGQRVVMDLSHMVI